MGGLHISTSGLQGEISCSCSGKHQTPSSYSLNHHLCVRVTDVFQRLLDGKKEIKRRQRVLRKSVDGSERVAPPAGDTSSLTWEETYLCELQPRVVIKGLELISTRTRQNKPLLHHDLRSVWRFLNQKYSRHVCVNVDGRWKTPVKVVKLSVVKQDSDLLLECLWTRRLLRPAS